MAAAHSPPPGRLAAGLAWMAGHRKALTGYAGLALSVAALAWPHAHWLPPLIAAATALGVHAIPNTRPPG